MVRLARALAAAGAVTACGLKLTEETWAEQTAGKTVLVRYYAKWCDHAKKMQADWEQLLADFEAHPTTLIADVECTGEGAAFCKRVNVTSSPTIKYGDPDILQVYDGRRTYKELKMLANLLPPPCSPEHIDLCPDDRRKQLEGYLAMSPEALDELAEAKRDEIRRAEDALATLGEELETKYQQAEKKKNRDIANAKASGLTLLKAVNLHIKRDGKEEEEVEEDETDAGEEVVGDDGASFRAQLEQMAMMMNDDDDEDDEDEDDEDGEDEGEDEGDDEGEDEGEDEEGDDDEELGEDSTRVKVETDDETQGGEEPAKHAQDEL